jgi:uncharacterized protein YndB with AHSA1/START domain
MKLSKVVGIPPPAVYYALTNASALREWLVDDARLDPRPGGRFDVWWRGGAAARGAVREAVPDASLTLTWREAEGVEATLSFLLTPVPGGTRVDLTVENGSAALRTFWREALDNLASVLEQGVDLRRAQQPLLGIGGGSGMTSELAAVLGVPTAEGFRVQSVVGESSAAAAGVAPDDVLVRVGNRPVTDAASLQAAMAGVAVGDTVPLTFYRGPIQMTVEVTVRARPPVTLPAGPVALAQQVRALHAEFEQELAALVDGAPAEMFEYRPAPEAWSARELLAHLILVERWGHHYLTLRVAGQPQGGYANDPGLHAAVSRLYEDVAGLLAEFQRAQATTAAALAALPQSLFANRKGTVADITSTFTAGIPYHTRTHIEEIRFRLEAARARAHTTEATDTT